jgi:hypothetical protein
VRAGDARLRARFMRTIGWLLVLACATSILVPAQESTGGDSTTIRALEHEWLEAQAHNDNGALDLIFDNALVYVEYGKLITKGDYLLRVKLAKPQPQEQVVMAAVTVHMLGSTAIVVGTYRETGVKDRKPFVTRWRFVDTWVNENGRWMLVAAAAAPIAK